MRIDWQAVPMAGLAFRELLEQVLALLRQAGLRNVYTNHWGMPPIWIDECMWLVCDWFPRVARLVPGNRCAVVEDAAATDLSMRAAALHQVNSLSMSINCFATNEAALTWLQQA